jgi:hypothetical protein
MARLLFYSALVILAMVSTVLTDGSEKGTEETTSNSVHGFSITTISQPMPRCPDGQVRVRGQCKLLAGKKQSF